MSQDVFADLPYRAWQEACRVSEIEAYTATLADLLAKVLPLWALAVYEFEPQSRLLTRLCAIRPGQRCGAHPCALQPHAGPALARLDPAGRTCRRDRRE